MKVSFLFWNLRGEQKTTLSRRQPNLLRSIGRLAGKPVDVFVLAECPIDPSLIMSSLNEKARKKFSRIPSFSQRIAFFSHIKEDDWIDRYYDGINDRITAQEFLLGPPPGLLVVGAHLDAPTFQSLDDRAEKARALASEIKLIERDVGHSRTILVGDLNMNPYDPGLIQPSALHAAITRQLAISVQKLKVRKGYSSFYNPMWSCFGESRYTEGQTIKSKPPGTYLFPNTEAPTNLFWNIYDQVLLRPEIMDYLTSVEILDSDGQDSLVTKGGRPKVRTHSDHLPIYFVIEF